MSRRRQRPEHWGRLNLLVNLARFAWEIVRTFWRIEP